MKISKKSDGIGWGSINDGSSSGNSGSGEEGKDTVAREGVNSLNKRVNDVEEVIDELKSETHNHENKDILDSITQSKINEWDNKSVFSGDYNNLINKPNIPTKISELENDNNFITKIPDEYITEEELNNKGYLTEHQDLSNYATKEELPTKVSELENDKNFATEEYVTNRIENAQIGGDVDLSNYATKEELFSKDYNDLTNKPTIPSIEGLATEEYVTNEIAKAQLEGKEIDLSSYALKSDLQNKVDKIEGKGLSTEDYTFEEKNKLNNIEENANNYTHPSTHNANIITQDSTHRFVSDEEKNNWNSKSNFSGNYNDLTNKPIIPTVTNDLTNALKSNYDEAYNHSQSAHAPSNAQKNSDITKSEIEAKLTGDINSHTHSQYLTEHQDMSGYAKTTDIPTKTSELTNDSNFLTSIPSEYITEEELNNKGYLTEHQDLSHLALKSETHNHKNKDILDEIIDTNITNWDDAYNHSQMTHAPNNAEPNVQSDWNIVDETSSAYIKNKPTIPTKISELENDEGYLTGISDEEIIYVNIEEGELILANNKYQRTTITNDTKIIFPSVDKFTKIHLYFNATNNIKLEFSDCKINTIPNIEKEKSYEIIATYDTFEWFVNIISYSSYISEVNEVINASWLNGVSISSIGEEESVSTRMSTTFIEVDNNYDYLMSVNLTSGIYVYFYDENKNFLYRNIQFSGELLYYPIDIPENVKYIRIRSEIDENITYENVNDKIIITKITKFEDNLVPLVFANNLSTSGSQGVEITDEEKILIEYVEVDSNYTYQIDMFADDTCICYYDENKDGIDRDINNGEYYNGQVSITLSIPENAKYFRFRVGKNSTVTFENVMDYVKVTKKENSEILYSFGLLSDVHIDNGSDGDNEDTAMSKDDYLNALSFLESEGADFIAYCGDMVKDYGSDDLDYTLVKTCLETSNIPNYLIRGNHDSSSSRWETYIGQNKCYDITYQNDIFAFVGYNAGAEYAYDGGGIDEENVNFITNIINNNPNKRIFIMEHCFIRGYGSGDGGGGMYTNPTLGDDYETYPLSKQFVDIVTKSPNVIFCHGHSHFKFDLQDTYPNANFYHVEGECYDIHVPSCSKPRTSSMGNYNEGSEGYLVDVYADKVIFKAIDFTTNSYLQQYNQIVNLLNN